MYVCKLQLWTIQKIAWSNWQEWRWFGGVFSWLRKIWFHPQVILDTHFGMLIASIFFVSEYSSFQIVHIIIWVRHVFNYLWALSFVGKNKRRKYYSFDPNLQLVIRWSKYFNEVENNKGKSCDLAWYMHYKSLFMKLDLFSCLFVCSFSRFLF